ncbi:MAG: hypothetical protein JKY65_09815 [Planctomycetes bacterium]|nr:hypothetical protein [Planctomycetota bacterium]
MNRHLNTLLRPLALLSLAVALVGCPADTGTDEAPASGDAPVFSLAWSEYPSWSTFGVADELKLIDGAEGKMGSIEIKWNVDIVLHEADYDSCITMFGSLKTDAACLTNMDSLSPGMGRPAVAILPTSTSNGADALIVSNAIADIKALKGKKVRGLAKSVSEYTFVRNLELLGESEADYTFTNMDPGAAALAMQQKMDGVEAIVVWNPFVMETLAKRDDTKVLFDSSTIPEEIIDMVVMGQDSLDKPGGDRFAAAIIETFYAVNIRLNDAKTRDDTLVALGEKFSNLKVDAMKKVCEQTVFYKNAAEGTALFTGGKLKAIMPKVIKFCVDHGIVESEPKVGYGAKADAPDTHLRFDPTYMKMVEDKQ